jgi:hypothetical protein
MPELVHEDQHTEHEGERQHCYDACLQTVTSDLQFYRARHLPGVLPGPRIDGADRR